MLITKIYLIFRFPIVAGDNANHIMDIIFPICLQMPKSGNSSQSPESMHYSHLTSFLQLVMDEAIVPDILVMHIGFVVD